LKPSTDSTVTPKALLETNKKEKKREIKKEQKKA